MPLPPRNEVRDIVEAWRIFRDIEARKTNNRTDPASLRRFVEAMNAQTRRLVAELEVTDPLFYDALGELCVHAATMVTKSAKVFVDKVDRTNE